jgi:hypothetical protein
MAPFKQEYVPPRKVVPLDPFLTCPNEAYAGYRVGMVVKEFATDDEGNKNPEKYHFQVDIDAEDGLSLAVTKQHKGSFKVLYDVLDALTVAVTPDSVYTNDKIGLPRLAYVSIIYDDVEAASEGEFSVRNAIPPISAATREQYKVIKGFGLF